MERWFEILLKMAEKYAELRLYGARCDNRGCSEGRFSEKDMKYESDHIRFRRAMEIINFYLQPQNLKNLNISSLSGNLVETEKDALYLINFAKDNIEGASSIIEPSHSAHGKIFFIRKIRFDNWVLKQRPVLITELKNSGYVPFNDEKDSLERRIAGTTNQINIDFFTEELAKVDLDKPWKQALKFY